MNKIGPLLEKLDAITPLVYQQTLEAGCASDRVGLLVGLFLMLLGLLGFLVAFSRHYFDEVALFGVVAGWCCPIFGAILWFVAIYDLYILTNMPDYYVVHALFGG